MATPLVFEQLPTNDAAQLRITLDRLVDSGAISAPQAAAWEQKLRATKHHLFYRETTSNLLFTVPAPQPYPPDHEDPALAGRMPEPSVINKRIRNSYDHALRHKKKDEAGFATMNAFRRATRVMNQDAKQAGSSKLFSQKHQATPEEMAEVNHQLAQVAEAHARMKSLKEAEQQKRMANAAARRARVVNYRGVHLTRQIEAEAAEEILQSQAADSTLEASYLMREVQGDDEEGTGELDGKQEAAAEQDAEQDPEAETPPMRTHPALPPSHGIAVPVAVPVAVPQQVSADKATASADSVVAPGVVGSRVPPPAPPLELSGVDVSPTISPAASRLSPELEPAPSAPGAVKVMPVSSGPELTVLTAELKELEAESAKFKAESAKIREQREKARQIADKEKAAAQKAAGQLLDAGKTIERLRDERNMLRAQLEEMQAQLEEMQAQLTEHDKTAARQKVAAEERMSKRLPPSPSNAPKPKPSGPSAKPRPGNA